MNQTGFQQAFNVGEVSPDAWSRSDLAQHSKGCLLGLNMTGRVAGPMGRRPGTWFCGHPKDQSKAARLIPFRRAVGDALLLEFGDLYMRVWTVNGTPVTAGGGIHVEIATTWTEAQLAGLRWRQVGDVIYFVHQDGLRPRTLLRNSNTSWTLSDTVFIDGPWRAENADETHVLTLSGTTLSASADTFTPAHVGGLFRLRASNGNPGLRSWEPEENVGIGAARVSNGRVYDAASVGACGNTPPVHERGTESDGVVDWEFHDDGAAVMRVTAFSSATQVTVQQLAKRPYRLDLGTSFWAESAYSDHRGWPTAWPAVREERLVLAAPAAEPDVAHLTRTAGFTPARLDFKPGLGTGRVVATDAVRRYVGEESNRIVWLASTTHLMAGTTDGEFIITGATVDDPIAPDSNQARGVGIFGSADVRPELAHDGVLFVAAGGQTLRSLRISPDQQVFPTDLSVVADHIAGRGLAEISWMKQPMNQLWCRLGDGGQAICTYHAEQNVLGWTRQALAATQAPTDEEPLAGGMEIESQAVLPGVAGRPRLFMLARRTKGGVTQRMILRLAEPEDKLFLDAAELYAGAATNGLAGLDHLSSEPVTLMAATGSSPPAAPGRGWGEYRDRSVSSGGAVALPEDVTATRIYAGLPFLSRWEGLPPEMAGPGSTAGRKVRYTHARVGLSAAIAYMGTVDDEGDSSTERFISREPGDVDGPVLRRKVFRAALAGGAGTERRLFVETDHGWDMVIRFIRPDAEVND